MIWHSGEKQAFQGGTPSVSQPAATHHVQKCMLFVYESDWIWTGFEAAGFEPAEFLQGGLYLLSTAQVLTGCIKGIQCSFLSSTHTEKQTQKTHAFTHTMELITTPLLARWRVSRCNSHLWICSRICPCCTEPQCPAIPRYFYRRLSILCSAREPRQVAERRTSSKSKQRQRGEQVRRHIREQGRCCKVFEELNQVHFTQHNSQAVTHGGSGCHRGAHRTAQRSSVCVCEWVRGVQSDHFIKLLILLLIGL